MCLTKRIEKPGTKVRLIPWLFECFKFSSICYWKSPWAWIFGHPLHPEIISCPCQSLWDWNPSVTTDTGAPMATFLLPFLYSIYTSECRLADGNCIFTIYANDEELIGLVPHQLCTGNHCIHGLVQYERFSCEHQ